MVWICNYVLLILLCNSYALKYIAFPIDTTDLSVIPDKKFNFCKSANEGFECKIKPSDPMLQLCAKVEIFKVTFYRGQPRAVLLLKFKHVMGKHLFNLTYVNEYIYVNGEFYVKIKWKHDKEKTQVRLKKGRHGAYVLATDATERRSIGNGGIISPEHEWVLDTVVMKRNSEIDNCSVVKIKVAEGFVHYRMLWPYAGFATEPYDDDPFTTTPPSITVLSEKKKRRKKLLSDSAESSKKASLLSVVFYVIAGVLLLIATPVLFFVGFWLGKCYAEKTALKKGLSMNVATSVSNANSAVDNIRNTETDNKQEASSKPSEKASSLKEMPTPISETDKNIKMKVDKNQ